jgi:formate dehydrogenase subunit delta
MHIERLVKMANDIGDFFKSEPSRADAIDGIAGHIQRFWEPRMRKQILEYMQSDGSELSELVREALGQVEAHKSQRTS